MFYTYFPFKAFTAKLLIFCCRTIGSGAPLILPLPNYNLNDCSSVFPKGSSVIRHNSVICFLCINIVLSRKPTKESVSFCLKVFYFCCVSTTSSPGAPNRLRSILFASLSSSFLFQWCCTRPGNVTRAHTLQLDWLHVLSSAPAAFEKKKKEKKGGRYVQSSASGSGSGSASLGLVIETDTAR